MVTWRKKKARLEAVLQLVSLNLRKSLFFQRFGCLLSAAHLNTAQLACFCDHES